MERKGGVKERKRRSEEGSLLCGRKVSLPAKEKGGDD